MRELTILVVEDEALARTRLEELVSSQRGFRVCGWAGDGLTALRAIEELRPDVLLLDIELPEIGGFDVLENLSGELQPAVVFVTAYDDYAVKAFEINAVDYVLKPVEPDRLAAALDRARLAVENGSSRSAQRPASQVPPNRIVVRTGNRILFLRPGEIDCVEAAGNYVRIHRGDAHFLLRTTMASMEHRLPPEKFVRIQRSKLVNVDLVRELIHEGKDNYVLVMTNGTRLKMSPLYRKNIEDVLGEF
ncbi:MAG TPA: LytTR family DNA-binding domain-containing protein [Thermoanaerobaculia bacterium]|nr:LytTR family DNA-binding domain-containing protein [Thermoanaerobaculia bacterium]